MSDIRQWLEGLGLGEYAEVLEAEKVTLDTLPELTDSELRELGLPLGPRKALLKAIREGAVDPCAPSAPTETAPQAAERRQITVMFCDLVGSTALSKALDPEDLRRMLGAYQKTVAAVVGRYDGHVAQYLGDGVMVYFGWPAAHEDDAQQAVFAGLDIVDAVAGLEAPECVEVRIGVATGLVVVGESGADEGADAKLAVGETPNIAARIQVLAEPGTVAIGQRTRRLLGGAFAFEDLGVRAVKGVSGGLRVHRVLGATETESRFEASHGTALTPLVGRESEILLLLDRWDLAKDGEGQVVLLSGEPGIGKSRITQVLRERLADEPHTWLRYHCSPYHTNSAFYPVIAQFERVAGFARDDTADQKLDKMDTALAAGTGDVAAVAPLFGAMLSLPIDRYPPLNLSPQKKKDDIIAALADQVAGLARQEPVLMIFEDAHWIDPTTLETLTAVIEATRDHPVLLIITYRPEFEPPWNGHSQVTTLTLDRFSRKLGADMVAKVTGRKALPDEVMGQIVAKTDGVPLFVEELTKAVLESELLVEADDHYELTGPLPPLAIPSTLQDSLMARLDRLAPVKEVAQVGAAIGREFQHRLLAAVSPMRDNDLQNALGQLVESELVFRRGTGAEVSYIFKHALVQDVAYESLLKSKRQVLHQRIAKVLEEEFPETVEAKPEILAHHYTEAEITDPAIKYWHRAGQRASKRSANLEAVAHLEKGLELIKSLPETPEHAKQELSLLMTLGPVLMSTKGEAASEVEIAYARARKLSEQIGEPRQRFLVLRGLWIFHLERAALQTAQGLGEQLLSLAEREQDSACLLEAHRALGLSSFWQGALASAQLHLDQGIAIYDRQEHRSHAVLYGLDPGVHCLSYGAWVLWLLGYSDQAMQRSHEARTWAQELSHPFSLAAALYFAARLHQHRREASLALEQAEAAVFLSTEQSIPEWLAVASILRGWALAEQGQAEEGIAQIQQGCHAARATGGELGRSLFLALLGEAYGNEGQTAEALRTLAEGLAMADKSGERVYEAELRRVKGELLLKQGATEAASEECFRQAIELARHQSARALELRAAMSLARLWQTQGKAPEARDLLAPVFEWFTEGFDTADLMDAKALLDELK